MKKLIFILVLFSVCFAYDPNKLYSVRDSLYRYKVIADYAGTIQIFDTGIKIFNFKNEYKYLCHAIDEISLYFMRNPAYTNCIYYDIEYIINSTYYTNSIVYHFTIDNKIHYFTNYDIGNKPDGEVKYRFSVDWIKKYTTVRSRYKYLKDYLK